MRASFRIFSSLLLCITTSYAAAEPSFGPLPVFTYAGQAQSWRYRGSQRVSALAYSGLPSFLVSNISHISYIPSSNANTDAGTYECIVDDSSQDIVPITIGPFKRMVDHSFDASLCGQGKFYDQREELRERDREDIYRAYERNKMGLLSEKEQIVDAYLRVLKNEHYEQTYGYFPPAHSFMRSLTRKLIDGSVVFDRLFQMPKGGNLHIHLFGSAEANWMAQQMFRMPGINLFESKGPVVTLEFSPLSDLKDHTRLYASRVDNLQRAISWQPLVPKDPFLRNVQSWESLDAWKDFQQKFVIFKEPVRYIEFFKLYVKKVLSDAAKESVLYMEIRHEPGKTYRFNVTGGKEILTSDEELLLFDRLVREVKAEFPNFQGARIIWPTQRSSSDPVILEALDSAIRTSQDSRFSHLIAGFDLIGEEDRGFTLLHHSKIIQDKRKNMTDLGINYMFHAGETNWAVDINGSPNQDVSPDENLFDAILHGSVRLGHAFALFKHPKLMEIVKQKNIALEIAPISNQLLRYSEDIRDHPVVEYLNLGLPVVICSDDPGIYGYQYLTHDYYQAFMSWGLNLLDLKALSSNGIRYSSLADATKTSILSSQWQTAWDRWIDQMHANASLYPLPPKLEFYNVYCGRETGGSEVVYDIETAPFSFNLTMEVVCSFDNVEGPGIVWSATQVKCFTPEVSGAREVSRVSATVNGHYFVIHGGSYKYYAYSPDASLASDSSAAHASASASVSASLSASASSVGSASSSASTALASAATSGASTGAAHAVSTATASSAASSVDALRSSASHVDFTRSSVLFFVAVLCLALAL